jgi:ribonuclease P protein component
VNPGPSIAAPTARYPRTARVRARPEFDAVFAKGCRAATPLLALHYLADDAGARLGLAVSRKVDSRAVIRNRIKRVLRDHFRRQRAALAGGAYVVVARPPAARASGPELIAAFDQTYRQALRRAALPPSLANVTMPPVSSPPEQAPDSRGATSPSAP